MSFVFFNQLPLSTVTKSALNRLKFSKLTPIQSQILPYTLAGYDAIGQAQTGTGKTVAFLISIIEMLNKRPFDNDEVHYLGEPRALVLAPTRELAQQVFADFLLLRGAFYGLCLTGGSDLDKQAAALSKRPVDVVIGTPGRIIDWVNRGVLFLDRVEVFVLDEADRMLDMGFIPDIKRIIHRLPPNTHRQSLLFSATFNTDVMNLAYRWLNNPVFVEIESAQKTNSNITQEHYLLEEGQKLTALLQILDKYSGKSIIFANRKDQVRQLLQNLRDALGNKRKVVELSGDVNQNRREKNLQLFKEGKADILVATDVAGRGIHVDDVELVVNFTLSDSPDDYVHRIGRTGRAGATGVAVNLIGENDAFNVDAIETHLQQKFNLMHFDFG